MIQEPEKSIFGEWGNFVFKKIEENDHQRILEVFRDGFYYQANYRIGYTKDMDDELEDFYKEVIKDEGSYLSFIAEEKATGKIAACRVITLEKVNPPYSDKEYFKSRLLRGFLGFYNKMKGDCDIFNKYGVEAYPHLLGVCVDEQFKRQGLATETYKRAKELMRAHGFKVALVSFTSPYSRAAAEHHDYRMLIKSRLVDMKDQEGNDLCPQADPNDFFDMGLFELA